MMTIRTFQCNMLQENTYILHDDSLQAVIIDCGAFFPEEYKALAKYLNDNGLTPVHLLCTHGHLDHCFGIHRMYEDYGLKPEVHTADASLVSDLEGQARDLFGIDIPKGDTPMGQLLSDNDIITFGSHRLQVIHTPGHSPGGVVFYCQEESVAFSGDTLFRMSVGRSDLPGGSWPQLMKSLLHIMSLLPDDTRICPGHGPQTTIADEKRMNPYMR